MFLHSSLTLPSAARKQISVSGLTMSEADKLDHRALKGHDPASSGRREVFVSADDPFSVFALKRFRDHYLTGERDAPV